MLQRLALYVVDHPWRTLVGYVLFMMVAIAGATRLVVDFSAKAFFSGDDPASVYYDAYVDHWGSDDRTIMIVAHAETGSILTPKRLSTLDDVTFALEALDTVERVQSLTNSTRIWALVPGLIQVEPVLDSAPMVENAEVPEFSDWAKEILSDDLLVPSLLAPDGSTSVMAVTFAYDTEDVKFVRPAVAGLREALNAFEGTEGLHFSAAGIPAVRADYFDAFFEDQKLFVPLAFGLIFVSLGLIFRCLHGVLIPTMAAFLPLAILFGIMGWTGEHIGLANQAFTTLLPAIAVADAIHMLARYHEALRQSIKPGERPDPMLRRKAVLKAVQHVGAACLLTSLTTSVGMFSLTSADMPILEGFGIYAALGIILAYGTLLTLVPIMLLSSRAGPTHGGKIAEPTPTDKALLYCAHLSIDHPKRVLMVVLLVVAAAGWFGAKVQVNNVLTALLNPEHPTIQTNHLIDEHMGGILTAEIDIKAEPGALRDPAVLQAMYALGEWAKGEPDVRAVSSPATLLRRSTELLTGEAQIPDDKAAIAQYFLLLESDEGLGQLVSRDWDRARVIIRTTDVGANRFESLSQRIQAQVEKQFDGLPVDAALTGTPFTAYRGINAVTADLRDSLLIAFFIIAGILIVVLRDLRTALLCFLPNAFPLLVGYGLMGLVGWELNPTSGLVFTLALAIAVDDTIHLIARWREEVLNGHDNKTAIRRAVVFTGRAVGITSVVLCGGFLINVLGSFPDMQVLGGLGATVIFAALLADLFILPALLALFAKPNPGASKVV